MQLTYCRSKTARDMEQTQSGTEKIRTDTIRKASNLSEQTQSEQTQLELGQQSILITEALSMKGARQLMAGYTTV